MEAKSGGTIVFSENRRIEKMFLFIILTYGITWVLWYFEFRGMSGFRIVGSFVPSLMGLFFLYQERGLFPKYKKIQLSPFFICFGLLYSVLSLLLPYMIARVLDSNTEAFHIRNEVGGITFHNLFMAALIFILVLVAGGPLGEEIGWRGYLFRKLCLRLNPLLAAVMVGIVWAGWHIPMFVFHVDGYEMSFALYLLQTIFLSIIISTVFVKCGCSIWAAVLFHTIDNFVLSIGYQEALGTVCTYSICYWSLQGIIVLILGVVLARTQRIKKNEPLTPSSKGGTV